MSPCYNSRAQLKNTLWYIGSSKYRCKAALMQSGRDGMALVQYANAGNPREKEGSAFLKENR